jgi:hypothetical protein
MNQSYEVMSPAAVSPDLKMGPRETVGELVGLVCRPRGHRGFSFNYALAARPLLTVTAGSETGE